MRHRLNFLAQLCLLASLSLLACSSDDTVTAAATAVVMKDASMPMVDTNLSIDRPFLYYLRDNPTAPSCSWAASSIPV